MGEADMKNKAIYLLCAVCIAMTACAKATDNAKENLTEKTTATITEVTETEKVSVTSESETTAVLTETTTTPAETTVMSTTRLIPVATFDETDEVLVKGQEFAEAYAEMSWNYFCGAAWDDYVNIPYFDFDDKSEGNYYEYDGIPYYKLLITDYTYDELIDYIKSFLSEELHQDCMWTIEDFIIGKDNNIYVNGNEPTFIYQLRNEHANIIGYTENDDGSVTYDCFAKTTEENDDDLYFSFTLNADGKLCKNFDVTLDMALRLFSDTYYSD